MTMKLSKDTANEYFATLNPIARKISIDIDETKSTYEHIWNQLSATEQTDIINETLIQPEIALRYFDNFSISSSSETLSNEEGYPTTESMAAGEEEDKLKSCDKLNTKNIYSYDGKTIASFCAQKTGSRVVHDEVIGIFRDEHSAPFSYKTKSQINLKLFSDNNANCKSSEMHQAMLQVQKYQKLASGNPAIGQIQCDPKGFDKVDGGSKYERFYGDKRLPSNEQKGTGGPNAIVAGMMAVMMDSDTDDGKGNFLSKFICKNNLIFNAGTNLILKANQVVGQGDEEDEGLNLIKNVSYSGLTSSSSVPSEEEEEKQICEDSKLLLENDELRKGFDFLNNW